MVAWFCFSCAEVPPCSAELRVYRAALSAAWAEVNDAWASVGSRVPRTCPAVTFWPAVTSTAVRVPLVPKLTESDAAALTLPDADTLDCTVPRWTVTVLAVADADDDEP